MTASFLWTLGSEWEEWARIEDFEDSAALVRATAFDKTQLDEAVKNYLSEKDNADAEDFDALYPYVDFETHPRLTERFVSQIVGYYPAYVPHDVQGFYQQRGMNK